MKLLTTLAVLTLSATVALADSLAVIPTLGTDTINTARAITPDGLYVVGMSGATTESTTTRGFLYPVGAASAINIYSSDNAQATIATGVGYRTSGGTKELVIAGRSYVSGNYSPTEWMTSNGGSTWGGKRRNASVLGMTVPAANSLGISTASDAYYISYGTGAAGAPVNLNRAAGAWIPSITYSSKGITAPAASLMNGVSASGRAVGWRHDATGTVRQNYMATWNGTATPSVTFFNGMDGTAKGEAFSVSANGNIVFGRSPITGDANNWGYKVVNPGTSQTITRLPFFGDETGSTVLQTPYGCSADGGFAVGMDYRGTEKAVFWDTRDANPLNWTITDLTALAQAQGILDGFTRLSRAYSIGFQPGTLSPVITGEGAWSGDGGVTYQTRAWVMVIPEPTTGALLGFGLLGLLALRRRK